MKRDDLNVSRRDFLAGSGLFVFFPLEPSEAFQ